MPNPLPSVWMLLWLLLLVESVQAQLPANDPDPVLFKSAGANKLFENPAKFLKGFRQLRSGSNGSPYLVQFNRIPDREQKKILLARGIELMEFIPGNAFLVRFTKTIDPAELSTLGITGFFELPSSLKQDPGFIPTLNNTAIRKYHVSFVKGMDSATIVQQIQKVFGNSSPDLTGIRELYAGVLELNLSELQLQKLLSEVFTLYALPAPELFELNLIGMDAHFGNLIHRGTNETPGLTGKGLTLGMGDGGRIYHLDQNYYEEDQQYNGNVHATHVAGTISGKGNINPVMKGFAPDANLEVDYFNNIIFRTPELYRNKRMMITNNSYGAGSFCWPYSGYYNGFCGQADQQLIDLPNLVHVFAAGNAETVQCGDYPVSYRTIDNAYQAAKNVLTVGGTNETGMVNVYSKGPTFDGRVKPEIVAVSTNVLSSVNNNNYGRLDGTSMACPEVSGSLALLYERYRQLFTGNDPDGALMKALVCNTATDVGTPHVDFANGYGWLNIHKALETLQKKQWFLDSIDHKEERVFEIQLAEEVTDFRVMLYWHDKPPSYYAAKALVNDLDITVELPDGTIFEPYILDTSLSGVLKPSIRGKDHLNNIEQVVIDRALPGRYLVRIKGHEIPFGPQSFRIVYNWEKPGFELLQPAGGEQFKPNQRRAIKWRNPGHENDEYSYAYSLNNGLSWSTITTGANQPGGKTWTVPSTGNTRALVRVTHLASGQQRISAPFRILPDPDFSLSSNCESELTVHWKKTTVIDSVAILHYNGTGMQEISITADTSFRIQVLNDNRPQWITLQTIKNGLYGERAVAKHIKLSEGVCPLDGMNGDFSLALNDSNFVVRTPSAKEFPDGIEVLIRNEGNSITEDSVIVSLYENKTIVASDTLVQTWEPGQRVSWKTGIYPVPSILNGEWKLVLFAKNDPNPSNDSTTLFWRFHHSEPVQLPYEESLSELKDTVLGKPGYPGLPGLYHWDARIPGTSIILHTAPNQGLFVSSKIEGQSVELIGNYNFINYSIKDNIRLDLDIPDFMQFKSQCFIRGNDTASWIEVPLFDPMSLEPRHRFINISEALFNEKQDFSSSFQLRLVITWSSFLDQLQILNGLRFYEAQQDLGLVYMVSQKEHVTDGDAIPAYLWIRNNNQTDSGPFEIGVSPPDGNPQIISMDNLEPGDTAVVSFTIPVDGWPLAVAPVKGWVAASGDNYAGNDTLTNVWTYAHKISDFPYLEGWESGKAGWGSTYVYEHSSRLQESIAPFSAANGNYFWGTQWMASTMGIGYIVPSGYLISPLFEISSLNEPFLSFSANRQLCDLRDSVLLQYSLDTGKTWRLLQSLPNQLNWYNNGDQSAWMGCNPTSKPGWQVITTPLPQNSGTIRFRLMSEAASDFSNVMPRNPGGFLIDDFHLYDRVYPLFKGQSASVSNLQIRGSDFLPIQTGNEIIASIKPDPGISGSLNAWFSPITGDAAFSGNKILPYAWIFQAVGNGGQSKGRVRLYISAEKIEAWLNDNPCDTCKRSLSAYDLSVFRYAGPVPTINTQITDNEPGYETVWDPDGFDLVPYDQGYYLDIPLDFYGEFYIGRNTNMVALDFTAKRKGTETAAILNWSVTDWKNIRRLELERANSKDLSFRSIYSMDISAGTPLENSRTDPDLESPETYQYRLKLIYADGTIRYSAIRVLVFEGDMSFRVFPNPGKAGQQRLLLKGMNGLNLELDLTDMSGKRLGSMRWPGFSAGQLLDLSPLTKGLPAGLYILRVNTGQQKKSVRLVISGN